MTFLAALRRDRVDAPWVLDGPINGEAFRLYVETELVKTLKPGDIVVLDNIGRHKGEAVRDIVRVAAQSSSCRPTAPTSIRWSKVRQLKHFMRRAARRSVEAVHNAIAQTLSQITPNECHNYIENAGYEST